MQQLEKQINSENNKENVTKSEEEYRHLVSRFQEIEKMLIDQEIQALQTEMEIKQEKNVIKYT